MVGHASVATTISLSSSEPLVSASHMTATDAYGSLVMDHIGPPLGHGPSHFDALFWLGFAHGQENVMSQLEGDVE